MRKRGRGREITKGEVGSGRQIKGRKEARKREEGQRDKGEKGENVIKGRKETEEERRKED